jgi:hypothetical protein
MATPARTSSSFPVSKEGRLYVVKEAGTLSLRRYKCKCRYFILKGKFAYIYKKRPNSDADARVRGRTDPRLSLSIIQSKVVKEAF